MSQLEEQAAELRALGIDAQVQGSYIVTALTLTQAIFLQACTITSGGPWRDNEPRTLGSLAAGQQLRVDPKVRRTEE